MNEFDKAMQHADQMLREHKEQKQTQPDSPEFIAYKERLNADPTVTPTKEQIKSDIIAHLSKKAIGGVFKPNEQQRTLMNQLHAHRFNTGNLEPKKGVLLYGSYGTGKTEILKAFCKTNFQPYNPSRTLHPTRLTTAIQMVQHYDDAGNFQRYLDKDLYIDDLGTEQRAKYKAKDEDHVLGKFLEIWSHQNEYKLYATTNLTLEEIGDRYGGRVYSRLHLMCNVIEFNGEDFRLKK